MTANDWIKKLDLQAHPEGGYFKEVYRSSQSIGQQSLPKYYHGDRVFGTSIYFLLTSDSVSNFHRLSSDEIWHYHFGGRAQIHMINGEGTYSAALIGQPNADGINFQAIIPRDTWFAAEIIEGDYILVGCTVAPGFEFEDFELADRNRLSSAYPQHQTLIERFTKT